MFKRLRRLVVISILLTIPVFVVGIFAFAYTLEFLHLKAHNAYFPDNTFFPAFFLAFAVSGLITLIFFTKKRPNY